MRGGKGSATTEERTAFCAASQTQVVHLHLTDQCVESRIYVTTNLSKRNEVLTTWDVTE